MLGCLSKQQENEQNAFYTDTLVTGSGRGGAGVFQFQAAGKAPAQPTTTPPKNIRHRFSLNHLFAMRSAS
jgi:hypothetical protein